MQLPWFGQCGQAGPAQGAVAFIHRFGFSLNRQMHFHVCAVGGVFEEVAGEGDTDADE